MRVGTYKKIFLSMLCVTALLALCAYLLPIDSLLVGYSSENGIGDFVMLPKLEGIGVLCMMSLTGAVSWAVWNAPVLSKNAHRIELNGRCILCLFLTPMGAIMLLVNLVRYLISII